VVVTLLVVALRVVVVGAADLVVVFGTRQQTLSTPQMLKDLRKKQQILTVFLFSNLNKFK
jgi:hypothetical protein